MDTCMTRYPDNVIDETATLRHLIKSRASLSRFGDGEFKIARGGGCVSQVADLTLTARLRDILAAPPPGVVVAIPRIVGRKDLRLGAPKLYGFWSGIARDPKTAALLAEGHRWFSSFITRADNAPAINCRGYWRACHDLWRGERVCVVAGKVSGNILKMLDGAASVTPIEAPRRDAWGSYADILARCLAEPADTAYYIALGPTATVLAVDLAAAGRRALDLGALDRFYMGGKHGAPA